ncbi:aldose epimerase family protein [Mucilaginibacter segetis]|uniref:Aldose 1-epimerase n=1 Tax=Mucilaginibacter segetis TaxID=2793071 RepID=A0A934UNA7_9SPHI|nr:aldose epimerase family protein [Mucilaginibacter segetis]MBK0379701.1 galactose mutarotase [Mucilaginibacter segetis]
MHLSKQLWGHYEGHDIFLFKLDNGRMQVALTNFGAIITGIYTPDKLGNTNNVVLGYDNLDDYISDEFYAGCIIGRFAGRISNASFSINGSTYPLAQNDGDKNIHLHGGDKGFGKKPFSITVEHVDSEKASVELYYKSKHLEEGYPGNLDVWVTYQLDMDNKFSIKYRVKTDHDTHINLTNHSYFNLAGTTQSALNNMLTIDADGYLVTNGSHIPTGEISSVTNTPYDFKTPRKINSNNSGIGHNECYVLNKAKGRHSAVLRDVSSGRSLILNTDMPALLFYSGDYLDKPFIKNNGICLETQYFPDSPNHPDFPSTLLRVGEQWESFTSFTFCCDDN